MSHLSKERTIDILCNKRKCQSVIYAITTEREPQTVLKGQEIWYEGRQPFRLNADNKKADRKIRIEAEIFEILGPYERIITYCGLEVLPDNTAWAIRLERADYGNLRDAISSKKSEPILWRIRVATQVAEGVAYLHTRGVIWGDPSTRNVLLCKTGGSIVAKLCDFADSALESEYSQSWYGCETRYCPPGPNPHYHEGRSRARELFALGYITCEITQWAVPSLWSGYGE